MSGGAMMCKGVTRQVRRISLLAAGNTAIIRLWHEYCGPRGAYDVGVAFDFAVPESSVVSDQDPKEVKSDSLIPQVVEAEDSSTFHGDCVR